MITISLPGDWTVTKHGPRNYTAKRTASPGWPAQTRFYFSPDAVDTDFPGALARFGGEEAE